MLSSLEEKPLEGQTQPVYLVKALPVNMLREHVLLLSEHSFVELRSTDLDCRTLAREIENKLVPEMEGVHGDTAPCARCKLPAGVQIRENWIPYLDAPANFTDYFSTDVHTNLVPQTPLLLNTICPVHVRLLE